MVRRGKNIRKRNNKKRNKKVDGEDFEERPSEMIQRQQGDSMLVPLRFLKCSRASSVRE